MKTSLSSNGRVVLPAEIRRLDNLQPGQQFEIERVQDGEYLLRKVVKPGPRGIARWLLACPEKDWFYPIDSESTGQIHPPRS